MFACARAWTCAGVHRRAQECTGVCNCACPRTPVAQKSCCPIIGKSSDRCWPQLAMPFIYLFSSPNSLSPLLRSHALHRHRQGLPHPNPVQVSTARLLFYVRGDWTCGDERSAVSSYMVRCRHRYCSLPQMMLSTPTLSTSCCIVDNEALPDHARGRFVTAHLHATLFRIS